MRQFPFSQIVQGKSDRGGSSKAIIKTLQENLGHAMATFTLDIYGHVSQKMRHQSAVKLESFIQEVNAQANQPAKTDAEIVPEQILITGVAAQAIPKGV